MSNVVMCKLEELNSCHPILLSTAYLGPVQYYSKLASGSNIIIEQWENYTKQSYRNRCIILSANGPLKLSIPVKRTDSPKILTKDIEIDYQTRWQDIHLRSIESAYRNSAYFLYYFDEISAIYFNKPQLLLDFNLQLQHCICELIGISTKAILSTDYIFNTDEYEDLRESIHPKLQKVKSDSHFFPKKYYQIFSDKFGFVTNLSIIDLLFNTGPEAIDILEQCNNS